MKRPATRLIRMFCDAFSSRCRSGAVPIRCFRPSAAIRGDAKRNFRDANCLPVATISFRRPGARSVATRLTTSKGESFRFGRTRVVRGGAPCERRRVSCTGELHWRCPSASPLGPRGGIRSPPAGRASGAAAERGLRHLRRRRRRRRRRRPPRRTRPRRLLGR